VIPLPVLVVCSALLVGSVALSNPFAVGACAAASAALLWAAPGPRAAYVWFAGFAAVTVFLINPFVSAQGLTTIWSGPHVPLLDTEVTEEEVVFGIAAALRILGSSLAIAAFVRIADGDRVLAAVARVAPRSAMIAALAARLLPALERDAAGLVLGARTRAARLDRRRPAAALAAPLVALSLERSLALAEAMEARGYGSGRRTRTPHPPSTVRERLVLAFGVALAVTVALGIRFDGYRYYDLLDNPLQPGGLIVATAVTLCGAGAALVVRWRR
jgi:energy-coupling factor transport system permease protein